MADGVLRRRSRKTILRLQKKEFDNVFDMCSNSDVVFNIDTPECVDVNDMNPTIMLPIDDKVDVDADATGDYCVSNDQSEHMSDENFFFETSFCSDSLPNDENLINDIRAWVSRNNAVPMNSVNDLLKL